MGTSYVAYKGFGFWTRDVFLESWLNTLLVEMRTVPAREAWQEALINHWQTQVQIDGGVMSAGLDEFLTDKAREALVLRVARQALRNSERKALRTGELFLDLVEGKLKTTVSSPVDYLSDSGTD